MPHFPQIDAQRTQNVNGSTNNSKSDAEDVNQAQQRIRRKNRRKRYLDIHSGYFKEPHLELADPLLYDRLVRRFQSAEEREKEGRERGYTGTLEADLMRSEAKLEALQHPDPNSPMVYTRASDGSITGVEQDGPVGKDDAWEKWKDVMALRFLRGDDDEFEYADVDENEEYDDRAEEDRRMLETYLEGEEERYVGEGRPIGQTGVQDF